MGCSQVIFLSLVIFGVKFSLPRTWRSIGTGDWCIRRCLWKWRWSLRVETLLDPFGGTSAGEVEFRGSSNPEFPRKKLIPWVETEGDLWLIFFFAFSDCISLHFCLCIFSSSWFPRISCSAYHITLFVWLVNTTRDLRSIYICFKRYVIFQFTPRLLYI